MKINGFAILSLVALVSAAVPRRGHKTGAYDDNGPLTQKSQVTAFVNTEDGLKVECWEIGDLLPDNQVTRADASNGNVRATRLAGNIAITLFSFAPSYTIFSFGAAGVHSNAVDFRQKPNLFTVKDGLIFIESLPIGDDSVGARDSQPDHNIFADVNGDDWFYFEDQTTDESSQEQCAKHVGDSTFSMRTISGSDTTLINFEYETQPSHTVLHQGRCNFAGLKPVNPSSQRDADSGRARFRSQEM